MKKILSERLRQLREKRNMTQAEVAEAVGIAVRTYQHYESGAREPNVSTFVALAQLFGVSLEHLAGLTDLEPGS